MLHTNPFWWGTFQIDDSQNPINTVYQLWWNKYDRHTLLSYLWVYGINAYCSQLSAIQSIKDLTYYLCLPCILVKCLLCILHILLPGCTCSWKGQLKKKRSWKVRNENPNSEINFISHKLFVFRSNNLIMTFKQTV